MRVAIFTDTFLPQVNGVTNTLNKIIEYFETNDIEYLIFAPNSYTATSRDYNVEKFFSLKFFLYPECRVSFPNIFRIKNALLNFKPDVIQLMTEFNMGIMGLNFGRKYNIPTISNYSTNFSQYLKYYNLEFMEKLVWNYVNWFHSQNDLTICPSLECKELLKRHGLINIDVFSRGIDSKMFKPEHRNFELRKKLEIDNKVVFLYVGRVALEKDIDILLDSYKKVSAKYKEKVALIITGDGPQLENYKRDSSNGIIFTGYKNGKDLAEIYASSDIFVFPSSTETFGNVVLEAMISDLPVIGANSGGVKDIISHKVNGLLFKAREVEELTNSMMELIDNEDLRNRLIVNGRKSALERSWSHVIDGLISIYNNVLCNRMKDSNLPA